MAVCEAFGVVVSALCNIKLGLSTKNLLYDFWIIDALKSYI